MTTPKELRELYSRITNMDTIPTIYDLDKSAGFLLEYADLLQKAVDTEEKAATILEENTRSISKRMGEIRSQ